MEMTDWNALRLVREYVKLANYINHCDSIDKLPLNVQVKVQRVASYICACRSAISNNPLEVIKDAFSYDKLNNIDMNKFKKLITNISNNKRIAIFSQRFNMDKDAKYLFRTLLDYRIDVERLMSKSSGIIEGTIGTFWGIDILKEVYNPKLNQCNEAIDTLIAHLLGETFTKTFTVNELKEKYNYPSATEEELLDYLINNL